ncbi:hypothetical protein lerEdw1_001451 [Lerista edwardsae]|nr:hypothetical protein lerEdw1_001451 [Lerista edwardsae]
MDPDAAFGGARGSLDEAPSKGMDGLLSAATFPASGHCRNVALGGPSPTMPGSSYAPLDGPPSDPGDPSAKPSLPCPAIPQATSTSSASPFSYGCFGGGYCSYRVARGSLKPCPAPPQAGYAAEKYVDACNAAASAAAPEEYQTRPAEFAFYPGYAGHYQPMASYLDVSVVQTIGGAAWQRQARSAPARGPLSRTLGLGRGLEQPDVLSQRAKPRRTLLENGLCR